MSHKIMLEINYHKSKCENGLFWFLFVLCRFEAENDIKIVKTTRKHQTNLESKDDIFKACKCAFSFVGFLTVVSLRA